MYELLAGAPPFNADSPVAVAYMHISEELRPLREANPGISDDVALVVETAMRKNLAERFPTAQSFRAALEDIAQGREPKLPTARKHAKVAPAFTGSVPVANVEAEHRNLVEGFEIFESRGIRSQSVPALAVTLFSALAVLLLSLIHI